MTTQQTTRTGPHPLPLYLGTAQFSQIVMRSPEKLQQMIAGIQKYQKFPLSLQADPLPRVWKEGETCLYYGAASDENECVASLVLVPSLINRSNIFDLHPRRSFLRWMMAHGVNIYLLDWGEPARDDMLQSLEALVAQRLLPALRYAEGHAEGDCYAMGYCMGGTILAAAAQHFEEGSGMCFLATPWDFSKTHPELLRLVNGPFNPVQYFSENQGVMPASYLQSLFASLDPDRAVEKFVTFNEVDQTSDAAELFVVAEDWLNAGVDLPRDIAQECLEGWFANNTPATGKWAVMGEPVHPEMLHKKCLVIASEKDRLVSYASACALKDIIPNAQHVVPDCGHIGMMAGRKAEEEVWLPILRWIKEGK